jgi:hypothetical protein
VIFARLGACGTLSPMLVRLGVLGSAVLLLSLGCTAGGNGPPDGGPTRMDAGRDAGSADSGPRSCTSSAECDDGHACTLDECVVGNLCRYDPLDARCEAGQRCVVGRGCVTGSPTSCRTAADCDDGVRCNGAETCIREMCIPGARLDCDDGNACTTDICDEAAASACRYEPAPGCDAGVPFTDAGPMCAAFDAARDYAGGFRLLPGQACDAGFDGYTLDGVTFAVSGGVLTVTAGRFVLTQSPAPTGPDFDVSGSDACARVRLMGRFECDTQFRATWTANHVGDCSTCGSRTSSVAGRRR